MSSEGPARASQKLLRVAGVADVAIGRCARFHLDCDEAEIEQVVTGLELQAHFPPSGIEKVDVRAYDPADRDLIELFEAGASSPIVVLADSGLTEVHSGTVGEFLEGTDVPDDWVFVAAFDSAEHCLGVLVRAASHGS